MAGTLTVTRQPLRTKYEQKMIERIHVSWTSDASGNADVAISDLYGYIIKLITDPAAAGSAPTDNYDITLVDEYGSDALEGAGADRDTANTETAFPAKASATVPAFVAGDVTFTVANAGNAKSGVAVFYIVECL